MESFRWPNKQPYFLKTQRSNLLSKMKPDSESNEPHEITDEQLDALLREVHVPADLKQDLLSIADVDLMVQPKPVSNTSTMGRWWVLAASVAAVALFAVSFFWAENGTLDPGVATVQPETKSKTESTMEAERLLAEMKQQQNEFNRLLAQSKLDRIERSLDQLSSSQESIWADDEMISTVIAIADQTPVLLGGSPKAAIVDMEKVVQQWPHTRGATIAREFIQQTNVKTQKDKS